MTQRERLTHEQHNNEDNQQMVKELIAHSVYKKMRKMGISVSLEEIGEYC